MDKVARDKVVTMETYVYEPENLLIMSDYGSPEITAIMNVKGSHDHMICGFISRYELAQLPQWEW